MPSQARARLLILTAAFLFSTGGAAIKATALDHWQVAGFRSGVAALALWLLIPAWRRFWQPRSLAVAVAYAATLVTYVSANKLTTAANAIFLQSTAPLYVLLLAPRLLGETAQRGDLARIGALAVGLSLFFAGREMPLATAPDPWLGNLVGAASGVGWGLTLMGLRRLGRDDEAHGTGCAGGAVVAGNLLAFLVCLPLALPVVGSTSADWTVIVYLGLFQIGLAYVCMTRGLRDVGALEGSLLLLLEPVLNALWAWAIHGELPGPWALAGCAMILSATVAMALRGTRGERARPV
jgi:DME family drug/metabolite transporter